MATAIAGRSKYVDADSVDIAQFVEETVHLGSFAFDVEHKPGLKWNQPGFMIDGVSFSNGLTTFYMRDLVKASCILQQLFPNPNVECIAFNAKYDLICLVVCQLIDEYGYPVNLCDPMVGVNLIDDNRKPNEMGLDDIVLDFYGYTMIKYPAASAGGLDKPFFCQYTCDDAFYEIKLWREIKPQMEKEGVLKLFQLIVMPSLMVFADMERTGFKWDLKRAGEMLRCYQIARSLVERRIKEEIGDVNLGSVHQLRKRLFEELGYSTAGLGHTKSGKSLSLDGKAMDILAEKYPICKLIRLWRTFNKMINTYVEPCSRMALTDPHNRVHANFWLFSSTGRTRCEKPNLQNQPNLAKLLKDFPDLMDEIYEKVLLEFPHLKRKSFLEIKSAFIAEVGWVLLVSDLSQIELRWIGHITNEPIFLNAYRHWQCTNCNTEGDCDDILHSCPNCGIGENERILKDPSIKGFWHGKDLHQDAADNIPALRGDRGAGKESNFAIGYCAGAVKMHTEFPDFSIRQWQVVIDQYLDRHRHIKKWHLLSEQVMWSGAPVVNAFGRKRRIPRHEVKKSPKHALNQIVNFGPQSDACDYIQKAGKDIRREFIKQGVWLRDIRPVNFVHDEAVFEVREEVAEERSKVVVHHLEHAVKLKVPVRASCAIVKNWYEGK